jgi:hypothetical protein
LKVVTGWTTRTVSPKIVGIAASILGCCRWL